MCGMWLGQSGLCEHVQPGGCGHAQCSCDAAHHQVPGPGDSVSCARLNKSRQICGAGAMLFRAVPSEPATSESDPDSRQVAPVHVQSTC
jgi:hypothetical protein